MSISEISTIAVEIVSLAGVIVPIIMWGKKLINGQRCQLRSDMLKIYYRNCESQEIRQYEFENFVLQYEAYKALKGNSFIDKINAEVRSWKIIS